MTDSFDRAARREAALPEDIRGDPRREPRRRSVKEGAPLILEPEWLPPDFGDNRRTRIGASVVEEFVAGHDASDVLRELVQNEYDGGGDRLTVTFGTRRLEVAGNGRGISADGWARLSVIVGTGRVVGDAAAERVAAKANGIGSKNFGLRSLFLFGDEIFVRSKGTVAVLDLRKLETGKTRDRNADRGPGVRLQVPFRIEPFEMLEPFTPAREEQAFSVMADGMLSTLVKLAHGGKRGGLREVILQSVRSGRRLHWRQDARPARCRMRGVALVERAGRLSDQDRDGVVNISFQEAEFARFVDLPPEFSEHEFPAYYRAPGGRVKIAVSLPIARRRIDLTRAGHFYYPLQTPDSRTGSAISVSAPFDLNNNRSSLTGSSWNEWLIDTAAEFVTELLREDWFDRYGADAFRALLANGHSSPSRFAEAVLERLKAEPCWPTRGKGGDRFAKASSLVLTAGAALDGLLDDSSYVERTLASDERVAALAGACGARLFTLNSLVRLRCAGDDKSGLKTRLKPEEADFRYSNFETALAKVDTQVEMAEALTLYYRKLTRDHKADLAETESTLNAEGELRRASDLIRVAPDIWSGCPEPKANRLHPRLVPLKGVSAFCRPFDEDNWLIQAAERAGEAASDDPERLALYAKLLAMDTPISNRALAALRHNPVVRNQRGEWTAPLEMVRLQGPLARLMDPVVDAPAPEMLRAPRLLARLRLREKLNGSDLLRLAEALSTSPALAERFEQLLVNHIRLLTPQLIGELADIPCIRARSGALVEPGRLHLDTPANRICIDDPGRIAASGNEILHRKLLIRATPTSATLLDVIAAARAKGEAPPRPELLYPALMAARIQEKRQKGELAEVPICWVDGGYHPPANVLAGPRIPQIFDHAVPVLRRSDEQSAAYIRLGASAHAADAHWRRFFELVSEWGTEGVLDAKRQRVLKEAYQLRGFDGLPPHFDDIDCLLDNRGRLFSLQDLRRGLLVEPDFPALEAALEQSGSPIGVVARSERSRGFFTALGIKPLTSIAGTGEPRFGGEAGRPPWFRPEPLLDLLRLPLFAHAVFAIALQERHNIPGFRTGNRADIETRLQALVGVTFHERIERRYLVGTAQVAVAAQVAIEPGHIGVVTVRTKLDFQHLVAEALAEIAGATSAAQTRSLATAFLPLVLCRSTLDIKSHLERKGISVGHLEDEEMLDFEAEDQGEEVGEDILRQLMGSLDILPASDVDSPTAASRSLPPPPPPPPPPPDVPPPPPFVLPDLGTVSLSFVATRGTSIDPPRPGTGGGGPSYGWAPRTPDEIERDAKIGRRGEELIYRSELERVRAMGHDNPEELVIWTASHDPGADHDIRSIDAEGNPRWIEVKSTTGRDGRFDWSRKEFERALRERGRYELWRVYNVGGVTPVAKVFPDPTSLVGLSRISIELGTLRANIEDMN